MEWLPPVWGETGTAEFPDQKTAEETISAVMAHYNSVAAAMNRSPRIKPIYEIDPNSDEVMWEPWVDGFTRAMGLRPEAWEQLLEEADEETQATMIFLMALQDIYTGQSKFTDDEIDEIDLEAPDLIPSCVATILHQSRPELALREFSKLPDMRFKAGPRLGRMIHAPVDRAANTSSVAAGIEPAHRAVDGTVPPIVLWGGIAVGGSGCLSCPDQRIHSTGSQLAALVNARRNRLACGSVV